MTNSFAPARHVQQERFALILDAWGRYRPPKTLPQKRLTSLLTDFGGRSQLLLKTLQTGDVDLATENVWAVGPPIHRGSPVLFPVATANIYENAGALSASVRVALISGASDGDVRTWGWRYDSAEQPGEGKTVPRPHAHAQPITGWHLAGSCRCLLHPHTNGAGGPDGQGAACEHPTPLNESHPAFPLRGQTLPGLALAFVVSLHGVQIARNIVDFEPRILKGAGEIIRADFDAILGTT